MRRFFAILWAVCGLVALTAWITYIATDDYDWKYEGKETFRTEESYIAFKEAVALPDVKLLEVTTLSSDLPIVVQFQVRVPDSTYFPYGELYYDGTSTKAFGIALAVIFGFTLGVVLPFFLLWPTEEQ